MDLEIWGGSWVDLGWILKFGVDLGWILGGSWVDLEILGGSWVDLGWILGGSSTTSTSSSLKCFACVLLCGSQKVLWLNEHAPMQRNAKKALAPACGGAQSDETQSTSASKALESAGVRSGCANASSSCRSSCSSHLQGPAACDQGDSISLHGQLRFIL